MLLTSTLLKRMDSDSRQQFLINHTSILLQRRSATSHSSSALSYYLRTSVLCVCCVHMILGPLISSFSQDTEREVSSFLSRKLSGRLAGIDMVYKEDLDLANHLVGLRGCYLKLRFHSVEDLIKAKRDINPAVRKNRERENTRSSYDPTLFTMR